MTNVGDDGDEVTKSRHYVKTSFNQPARGSGFKHHNTYLHQLPAVLLMHTTSKLRVLLLIQSHGIGV